MKPSRALAATLSTLLAADTGLLASATANKIALITNEINPGLDTVVGDLTLLSGNGLDPIALGTGAQVESVDPLTAELIVQLKPPAGGLRWEVTGGSFPVVVRGFAVVKGDLTALYGCEMLSQPVTLTAINQAVNAPPMQFRIDPNAVT